MAKRHDRALREQAIDCFESGLGWRTTASKLCISKSITKQWYMTYKAVGREVLLNMGKTHRIYDFEIKVAAAKAVVEDGQTVQSVMTMYSIASRSGLLSWCRAFREGGAEALRAKPKGRPAKTSASQKPITREQELERRVRQLEAENAYLKKLTALRAQKR